VECLSCVALPDVTTHLWLAFEPSYPEGNFKGNQLLGGSIGLSPLCHSQATQFARQNSYRPPPQFPMASSWNGIVHHLSGPMELAFTQSSVQWTTSPVFHAAVKYTAQPAVGKPINLNLPLWLHLHPLVSHKHSESHHQPVWLLLSSSGRLLGSRDISQQQHQAVESRQQPIIRQTINHSTPLSIALPLQRTLVSSGSVAVALCFALTLDGTLSAWQLSRADGDRSSKLPLHSSPVESETQSLRPLL